MRQRRVGNAFGVKDGVLHLGYLRRRAAQRSSEEVSRSKEHISEAAPSTKKGHTVDRLNSSSFRRPHGRDLADVEPALMLAWTK